MLSIWNRPSDLLASEGLNISLTYKDLGGVSVGSGNCLQKIPIGEVYNYQLNENVKSVTIQAAIKTNTVYHYRPKAVFGT